MNKFYTYILLLFLLSCVDNKEKEQKEVSKKMASELCECLNNDSTYVYCIMTLQENNPKYEELTQKQLLEEINKNCPEKSKSINDTYVEAQ